MPSFSRGASHKGSKREKRQLKQSTNPKHDLAIDTSFSRHHGKAPEQVFPEQQSQKVRFVSLTDVRSLKNDDPGLRLATRSKQQLDDKVYIPSSRQMPGTLPLAESSLHMHSKPQNISQAPNIMHKRIKGLRPAALELSTDVSPSDRAIPIGIEVPTKIALSKLSNSSSESSIDLGRHELQPAGKELPTPTIVITPAREDFGASFTASPEEMNIRQIRPTSSIYSTDVNQLENGRTPPVPPLPLFAAQSNASLQMSRDLAPSRTGAKRRSAITLHTVFEEGDRAVDKSSSSADSRYSTAASVVSRRSIGWWNVITSPFSPATKSPGAFFRSPPQHHDSTIEESDPILSQGAQMGRSKKSRTATVRRTDDNGELRSAPADVEIDRLAESFADSKARTTPQRSDTAPGALDLGKADEVKIYRQPSKGAARSYFDRNSLAVAHRQSAETTQGLAGDDWSPSKSCYQESLADDKGMRESEFYLVPGTGEAAAFYNSNVRFPSLAPYGAGFGDRGLDWDPRNSVAPVLCNASNSPELVSGSLDESPIQSADSHETERAANSSLREATASSPDGGAVQLPYPINTDPFRDPRDAQYDDLGQPGVKGYGPDLTPNSGDVTAFKDFSATHPAAQTAFFPDSLEDKLACSNPVPGTEQHDVSEDVFSPLLETPKVEEARTATFMPPEAQREVEVASARPRAAPEYGAGLGAATMSSREMNQSDYGSSVRSSMEDSDSGWEQQYPSENTKGNFGYLAEKREPAFNYRSEELSEKPRIPTNGLDRSEAQDDPTDRPWYKRFARVLVILAVLLLIGLVALLLVLFVPWPQHGGPTEAAWMNLTGFPPMPTGVATVVSPKLVQQVDGCIDQPALWSCGMPTSRSASSTSDGLSVPNFKFQVQFRKGILPSNETTIRPSNNTLSRRSMSHASGASHVVRRDVDWDLFHDFQFTPSPAAPTTQDQMFLGKTTDNTTAPFEGERTPFYISVLDSSTLTTSDSTELRKRDFHYPYPKPSNSTQESHSKGSHGSDSNDPPSFHYPYPDQNSHSGNSKDAPSGIPSAPTSNGGDPAPAELYPLPYAQPLKLYNRGLSTEHYGFYTYFDRTIYVSSSSGTVGNSSATATNVVSNTRLDSSTAVCTWSQTRMLVQIWTQRPYVAALNATAAKGVPAVDSTANDMTAPGSFPYSVTVTLDRHGGDASEKGVYCHSLDDEHHVVQDVRTWVTENRAFGGDIINPAAVPTNNGTALGKRGENQGGIDGGTGGCKCQWQNW